MRGSNTLFTQKIIVSYLLLAILALIVSLFVYAEIRDYLASDTEVKSETKLLIANSLLTQLHEAESLSKLAIQSKKQKHFNTYSLKIDSVYKDIDNMKRLTKSLQQHHLLDSLKLLLGKKVANNEALLSLISKNQTSLAISMALQQFDEMEASLGIITSEALVPNLKTLSPKAQEAIKKVTQYLNENVPNTDSNEQRAKKADSILRLSKALLKEVKDESAVEAKSLASRESNINTTDFELSQQLRHILASFEKEILINSFNENIKKEAVLKRSIRLASIAAVLGFLVVGVFVFILNKDFWKAKLYRQKLEKEKNLSETLLKSREHLIRAVSHDVRTPLNTIFGYTELLKKSELTQQQDTQLTQIKSAADYVNNLVQDLLDFSQLEAGKMNPENSAFNLSTLIRETAENIAMSHGNEAISLVLDIDETLNRLIFNDALRIMQIISNILDNAYKFTKDGEIEVQVELKKNSNTETHVSIRISDTGIGIPATQQQAIFGEFTQAENKSHGKQGGYGLGLTISKKLSELLGGTLDLESTLGKGSVLTLKLPITFINEAKPSAETEKIITFKKALSILVVEDDTTLLQMIGETLKQANIFPILLNDFDELEQYIDLSYDLVLTDIEMPTTTGYGVVKKLGSGNYTHYKNQPIIAMTGRQDLDESLLLDKGFSAIIKKPFTATELFKIVSEFSGIETEKSAGIQEKEKLFTVDCLKLFLGNEAKAIQELLQTFQNDTLKNKAALVTAQKAQNHIQISAIAHRMLPMFRQMNITSCIPILETFEKLNTEVSDCKVQHNQFQQLDMALEKLLGVLQESNLVKHPNHSN